MKTSLMYCAFFASITFTASHASAIKCSKLFSKAEAGLLATKVRQLETRAEASQQLIDKNLELLSEGFAGYQPISKSLLDAAAEARKPFKGGFDVYTTDMGVAKEKFSEALKASKEFGSLSAKDNELVTDIVTSNGRNTRIPLFSARHILAQFQWQFGLVKSDRLNEVLATIQFEGKQNWQVYEQIDRLQSLAAGSLKGVMTRAELNQRYAQAVANRDQAGELPADLVAQLNTAAKKYNSSSRGGFDVLTPGHQEAQQMYNKLVAEHPYFKEMSRGELDQLQWNWHQATTPALARSLMAQMRRSSAAAKFEQEMKEIDEARDLLVR